MSKLSIKCQSVVHFFSLHPSGTLLATCCSDGTVQIYTLRQHVVFSVPQCHNSGSLAFSLPFHDLRATRDKNDAEEDTEWELVCELCDHIGSVYKCCWCPVSLNSLPVLVTVGADRAIFVYHFQQSPPPTSVISENAKFSSASPLSSSSTNGTTAGGSSTSLLQATRWHGWKGQEKDTITDIAFLPPGHQGLMVLSTASLDGCVRLYKVRQNAALDGFAKWFPDTIVTNIMSASRGTSSGGATGAVSVTEVKGAVTALSWFPGKAESSRTIAVGCMSGKIALAQLDTYDIFKEVCFSSVHACSSPVISVAWAPPMGRRFILFAACSRHEVLIFRLHVCSPEFLPTNLKDGAGETVSRVASGAQLYGNHFTRSSFSSSPLLEVFRCESCGACGLSWSNSATILGLVTDPAVSTVEQTQEGNDEVSSIKRKNKYFFALPKATCTHFLQMRDARNHQSWTLLEPM